MKTGTGNRAFFLTKKGDFTMLSAFFKENAKAIENAKVVISDRFVDENGEPEKWEIRAIDAKTNEILRDQYQPKMELRGRKVSNVSFNQNGYARDLLVHCVVYPDLYNKDLQDAYGVKDPVDLILAMLTPGEYTTLMEAVNSINGFDVTFEDKVEAAKN